MRTEGVGSNSYMKDLFVSSSMVGVAHQQHASSNSNCPRYLLFSTVKMANCCLPYKTDLLFPVSICLYAWTSLVNLYITV